MVDIIVIDKFSKFKVELSESRLALENFIATLPNKSNVKEGLSNLLDEGSTFKENIINYIEIHLIAGDIDLNIMTKLDKDNFVRGE